MTTYDLSSYLDYGFVPCEFEPDRCDRCKQVKQLFFGDRDYFDSREGNYLCANCLNARIEADKEFAYHMEEAIESQRDHESQHMPWMH